MTTIIQGDYIPPTATNLTQSVTRTLAAQSLSPIVLTTSPSNFSKVYTITFTLSGSWTASNISFDSSISSAIPFIRVSSTVITLSSQYTLSNGVTVNNWAYFKLMLRNLRIKTSTTIWPEAAGSVAVSLSDGTTNLTGTMTISSLAAQIPTTPVVTYDVTSKTSTKMTWPASTQSAGPGIGGYYVYRNGSIIATLDTSTLEYTDPVVDGVTSYTYKIVAFDLSSTPIVSPDSNSYTVTVTTPTAPVVTYNVSSKTSTYMNWTASNQTYGLGISGYRIYRNGSLLTTLNVTPYLALEYTDPVVDGVTSYTYKIVAFDFSSTPIVSPDSNSFSISVTTPTTPGTLSYTRTWDTTTVISPSWAASSQTFGLGIAGYEIWRTDVFGTSLVATVSSTTLTYADQLYIIAGGNIDDNAYTYYIVAYDGSSTPIKSANSANIVALAQTTPTTPAIGTATKPDATHWAITWGTSTQSIGPGVDTYELGIWNNGTEVISQYSSTARSATGFYQFPGSGQWKFRVRSRAGASLKRSAWSSYSNILTF